MSISVIQGALIETVTTRISPMVRSNCAQTDRDCDRHRGHSGGPSSHRESQQAFPFPDQGLPGAVQGGLASRDRPRRLDRDGRVRHLRPVGRAPACSSDGGCNLLRWLQSGVTGSIVMQRRFAVSSVLISALGKLRQNPTNVVCLAALHRNSSSSQMRVSEMTERKRARHGLSFKERLKAFGDRERKKAARLPAGPERDLSSAEGCVMMRRGPSGLLGRDEIETEKANLVTQIADLEKS
jgi:surface antigen